MKITPDCDKKLFLIDAMAIIYRSYYAMTKSPRINSKKQNTSAAFGFTNTLFELLKNEQPTHIGIAFDMHAPTVRSAEYAAYKAQRESTPEDILLMQPYIRRIVEALNIPILEMPGYEADDIIGTLSQKAEQNGFTTYMFTPDKDYGQLVTDHTFIYKPANYGKEASLMGVKEVCEKYGIKHPEQLIDILGLWGDAVDNIPGIPGVGEITARRLVQEYGSVENLVLNADKIKNDRLREKVIANAEQGLLSKQLATILLDVPIEFDPKALELTPPNLPQLKAIFDELEFMTLGKRILSYYKTENSATPKQEDTAPVIDTAEPNLFSFAVEETEMEASHLKDLDKANKNYTIAATDADIAALFAQIDAHPRFAFAVLSAEPVTINAMPIGIAFCFQPDSGIYLPLPKEKDQTLTDCLQAIFSNPDKEKISYDAKRNINLLRNIGVRLQHKSYDIMLAHYLQHPEMRQTLDFMATTLLEYQPISLELLTGKGKNKLLLQDIAPEQQQQYACEQADLILQLHNLIDDGLDTVNMRKLFTDIEMPLTEVLADMEYTGVCIDSQGLNEISKTIEAELQVLQENIYAEAGTTFNISSPKQLGEVLFGQLRIINNAKMTRTKQYQTGEEVLQKLVGKHPIVQPILDYRALTKLKSTYVDSLPEMINPKTGRIHTSYNQAIAVTGRLSSANPNLQNIPVRTERGREIRKAFVAADNDHILLAADYSQIELRIIAELSQDVNMLDAFRQGIDIHTATASRIYEVPIDEVTRDMRRKAKTVNFGIIYGMSAFGLSERLNLPRKESAEIIAQYFEKYPHIKTYIDQQIRFAQQHGYVETIMHRRRYLRDISSQNAIVRGFDERNAVNAPIQGSAADLIKIAMIRIFHELNQRQLKSKMIMQVHDELIFEVYKPELEEVKQVVADNMTHAISLSIPLDIDMNTGENWLEAH